MQKVTLLLIFSLVFTLSRAQISFPFPTDSVEWTYLENYGAGGGSDQFTYSLNGDSIIDSITYSKLYIESVKYTNRYYGGAIRKDSVEKVYFLYPDSINEHIIYDFGLEVGDTFYVSEEYLILESISQIEINGMNRKYYHFDFYHNWIEGIGDEDAFFRTFEFAFHEYSSKLQCFHQKDTLIYLNPDFENCEYDDTGIDELNKFKISIVPHPISNTSQLSVENLSSKLLKIDFYNSKGQIIKSELINNNSLQINRKAFDSGLYYYKISNHQNEILKSGKIVFE